MDYTVEAERKREKTHLETEREQGQLHLEAGC